MDTDTFDGLMRQIGRRLTLQALGGAAIAMASGAVLTDAKGDKNKNNNKQQRKKQQKRVDRRSRALCAGQVAQCDAFIASNCGDNAECLAAGQACCDTLATCDFAGLVACLAETNGN